MTNTHNVENDLMGRNRIITRDIQEYEKFKPNTKLIQYKSDNTHTIESRSDMQHTFFYCIINSIYLLLLFSLNFLCNIHFSIASSTLFFLFDFNFYAAYIFLLHQRIHLNNETFLFTIFFSS